VLRARRGDVAGATKSHPRVYRIFLSSTYGDLKRHRIRLYDDLIAAGYAVERMEDFGSSGLPPLETCLRALERSDAVVVILGYRYGSTTLTDGVSYTEAEYEHAQGLGLPIYVYLRDGFDEGIDKSTEPLAKKTNLRKLRTTMESDLVVTRHGFTTPTSLSRQVLADLAKWPVDAPRPPIFRKPGFDIMDVASYAAQRVLRANGKLLAPPVVLVDASAAHLPKTPLPTSSRVTRKLLLIERELLDKGYTVHLFTDLTAFAGAARPIFDQRLAQVAASQAIVVGFARDADDLEVIDRFAGAGLARMIWYRDVAPVDTADFTVCNQFTGAELNACAVAVAVEAAVVSYAETHITRGLLASA